MKFLLGHNQEQRMEEHVREAGCRIFPGRDMRPGIERIRVMKTHLTADREQCRDRPVCLWFPEAGVHATETVHLLREIVRHGGSSEIFVVTFGKAMVNQAAVLVEKGRLAPDQVEILMFEDDGETVTEHRFSEEGYVLEGWPYGWFLPRHQAREWIEN